MINLLVPAFAYLTDYMNGTTPFIRSTKNGRKKTFNLKLIISIAFTTIALLLFEFMDFFAVYKAFTLPLPSASAFVLNLNGMNSNLSLGELYAVSILFKTFVTLAVTVSIFCLSQLILNPIAAISFVAALIFLPYLLSLYFTNIFNIFPITDFYNINIFISGNA